MDARIPLGNTEETRVLFGPRDQHLRQVREALKVECVVREGQLVISGSRLDVKRAEKVMIALMEESGSRGRLSSDFVTATLDRVLERRPYGEHDIDVLARDVRVSPRTPGQAKYVEAMKKNELVFCIGPAGTGKTYLAVAMAIQALKHQQVRRIILARPAVEAGEKLGFLPGDMQAKVNPYLRPLYDALADTMDFGQLHRYMENDMIEVSPLAFMRGRTLNHAFVILDEAQNCTTGQMKMCLTRIGEHSRAVVTGDVTQIDLPPGEKSGLVEVEEILKGIKNIQFAYLESCDIVRHRLVQNIVEAYQRRDRLLKKGTGKSTRTEGESEV